MALTSEHVAAAVRRAAGRLREIEAQISEADAALGDGDTGLMLRRLFDRLDAAGPMPSVDIGEAFRALGLAGAGVTGSSLGTLIVVALLHLSKATVGKREVAWVELSPLLDGALRAMMARGKASLGDKTVLDPINAVARAISGKQLPAEIAAAAIAAGRSCLLEFRDRPCRIGRARMFADKSVGRDDPGQLAFVAILEVICGG